jgi:hypothetical protein
MLLHRDPRGSAQPHSPHAGRALSSLYFSNLPFECSLVNSSAHHDFRNINEMYPMAIIWRARRHNLFYQVLFTRTKRDSRTDGLTKEEFDVFKTLAREFVSETQASQTFEQVDVDHDGVITSIEALNWLSEAGLVEPEDAKRDTPLANPFIRLFFWKSHAKPTGLSTA